MPPKPRRPGMPKSRQRSRRPKRAPYYERGRGRGGAGRYKRPGPVLPEENIHKTMQLIEQRLAGIENARKAGITEGKTAQQLGLLLDREMEKQQKIIDTLEKQVAVIEAQLEHGRKGGTRIQMREYLPKVGFKFGGAKWWYYAQKPVNIKKLKEYLKEYTKHVADAKAVLGEMQKERKKYPSDGSSLPKAGLKKTA